MLKTPSALIMMSTYNGEKYLAAQLDSMISQTFSQWVLLIRDDGSSDATLDIIKKYITLDSRIIYLDDQRGNLKIIKSYSALMEAALKRNEDYIFFSDQDDIWLPHKVQASVDLLSTLENQYQQTTPLLIHSDLRVVNDQLQMIHPSYLQFEHLTRNPDAPLKTLLINNYVTGCTVAINRALLILATPIPDNVFMHDWWCALCAAADGYIGFISEPTILYRQHGGNSVGSSGFYGKLKDLISLKKSFIRRRKNLTACFYQAKNLLDRLNYLDRANVNDANLVTNFSNLYNKNIISRYLSAIQLHLQPASYMRALLFWLFLAVV